MPSRRGTQRACLRVLRAEGQVQCAVFSQRGLEFLAGQCPHFRRQMGQSPTEYRAKVRNGGHVNRAIVSLTGEFILHRIDGQVEREYSPKVGLNLFKFVD